MPELPEVENVKLSLQELGLVGQKFSAVELRRKGLRTPFTPGLARKLKGQTVQALRRRAKFLLMETDDYVVLNHLGMTGSWRPLISGQFQKHDHLVFGFESGLKLVFHDPRRFGVLELAPRARLEQNRWLCHLGVEPLERDFSGEYLFAATRRVKAPIKNFIMDQRRIVGVGNIYASEALFAARVRPTCPAGRLTRAEADRLVGAIRRILIDAIRSGGSTIRDYRNSKGESGSFQARFQVYDRNGLACFTCGTAVRSKHLAGRNTYWCPRCQR